VPGSVLRRPVLSVRTRYGPGRLVTAFPSTCLAQHAWFATTRRTCPLMMRCCCCRTVAPPGVPDAGLRADPSLSYRLASPSRPAVVL